MNVVRHKLVMAVFPNARGLAFAVFEGPFAPIDWGTTELRGSRKNKRSVARVSELLGRYQLDTVVLQDTSPDGTRRINRVRRLNQAIALLAETESISVVAYTRADVRACFAADGFATKQQIAESIAKRIGMFERLLPPPRKLWNSEHPRMGLFDATALALTYYARNENMAQKNR